MIKAQKTIVFSIEPTQYGWIVRDGTAQLGLFVSQRQALDHAKQRQRILKEKGQQSSVATTVKFPEDRSGGPLHRHWSAP